MKTSVSMPLPKRLSSALLSMPFLSQKQVPSRHLTWNSPEGHFKGNGLQHKPVSFDVDRREGTTSGTPWEEVHFRGEISDKASLWLNREDA